MSLLTTLLVFITIGCVYSEDGQFGQFDHDFDEQLAQLGKSIDDKKLQFSKLSQDMDRQLSQFGKDINKNVQFDRAGQDIDKNVENLGKHLNTFGNQMGENVGNHMNTFGNGMANQFEKMGNQFENLGNNLEKQFSNMQFNSQTNRQSHQSLEIDNLIKIYVDRALYSAKEICVSAGHSEVAVPLENEFTTAYQCLKGKVDVKNLKKDFSEAARTNDLTGFFNDVCKIWPNAYHCVKPAIAKFEKCLSSNEVEAIEKTLDLVDDSNSFFCDNDANRIIQFIQQGGGECFEKNTNDLQGCVNTAAQTRQRNGNNGMITYNAELCNEFNDLRRCLVDRLRTCPSQTPAEIFDEYLGFITRKACNSASSIAWFSFVNMILLLFTYLYSKMF